jgi:hypothetical protein
VYESELEKYEVIRRRTFVWKYFNKKSFARGECKMYFKMIQTPVGLASGLVQLLEQHPFVEIVQKIVCSKEYSKRNSRKGNTILQESFSKYQKFAVSDIRAKAVTSKIACMMVNYQPYIVMEDLGLQNSDFD